MPLQLRKVILSTRLTLQPYKVHHTVYESQFSVTVIVSSYGFQSSLRIVSDLVWRGELMHHISRYWKQQNY